MSSPSRSPRRSSVLSRYLDPEVLGRLRERPIEPRDVIEGHLAGRHRSTQSGFAVEFAGHRPYTWGDDPKHIDWRVYFTRELYVVRQYATETSLTCHLIVDTSASMRYGEGREEKLAFAYQLALSLAWTVVRQSDLVGLATFDEEVGTVVPPGRSLAQLVRLAEALDRVSAGTRTRVDTCVSALAPRVGRRGIVFILSDFLVDLDQLEPGLAELRFQENEVVLLQILHADELEFRLRGGARFVGLEDDATILANPGDVRDAYLIALESYLERLDALCERHGIERVLCGTHRGIAETLVDYLESRGERPRR